LRPGEDEEEEEESGVPSTHDQKGPGGEEKEKST